MIGLPSFIRFDEELGQIVIRPSNPETDLGFFYGKISLSDSNLEEKYPFKVEVINKPPQLTSRLKDQKIFLGNPLTYKLPSIEDEEGLPVRRQPQFPLPAFVIYDISTTSFKFNPVNPEDVGTFVIVLCFKDDFSSQVCSQF